MIKIPYVPKEERLTIEHGIINIPFWLVIVFSISFGLFLISIIWQNI